jgi:hypothetical protein
VAAFLKDREHPLDAVQGPVAVAAAGMGPDQQIFLDRQRREKPPPFGNHRDAADQDLRRRQPCDVIALQRDGAGGDLCHSGDGAHQGCLARAVRADDCDGLAFGQRHVDTEQGLEVAIMGGKAGHVQKRAHASIPR